MANIHTECFKAYGALEVKTDTTYTAANIPASANLLKLARGVRITDKNGDTTRLRGVRVQITNTSIAPAVNPLPNIPTVWIEGEITIVDANTSVKFFDNGIVTYGVYVDL